MDSNMMNMCNMCMHKAYCPMTAGMEPMNMQQMPMEMDMDMDKLQNMDLMQDMNLTDDMMENMRTDYSIDEDTEDITTNTDFVEDIDVDFDLTRRRKNSCDCNVDRVLRKIERNNPGIFRRLMMCGMPYFQAKRFVGRIISLSLNYCRD